MAPIAVDSAIASASPPAHPVVKPAVFATTPPVPVSVSKPAIHLPPQAAQERYRRAGIDISKGYPYFPPRPDSVEEVEKQRLGLRGGKAYVDPATRADPEKNALFAAAKEVRNLTAHIGTELVGIQLSKLTDQQKDELALLVAERVVVFAREQDISPREQVDLGLYLGDGEIERHPSAPQAPVEGGGISLIWWGNGAQGGEEAREVKFRSIYPSGQGFGWHTDLVHEPFPPAYTHLFQDTVPKVGGDTLWASGYAAYDKLSPKFQSLIDGLNGIYRSANKYKGKSGEDEFVYRTHPLVRTVAATGLKAVYVNRAMTVGIEGLDKAESDAILNVIYDVYERSTDIQLRWSWTPNTSAIWDNRASIHTVSFDYNTQTDERHGTRVSSLAEKPYFDPSSKSQRQSRGLVN